MISDNGASAEGGVHGTFNEALFFNMIEETLEDNLEHFDGWGGVDTFPHYSWGWTWAGDTPFRRWKRETYRGGVSDPCDVFWPDGIEAAGEIRTQYNHAIDLVPTILDSLGIEAPAIDTNLQRVLSRWFGDVMTDSELSAYAESVVTSPAGDWNQALMDLGSQICRPKNPECGVCPVNQWCTDPTVYSPPRKQASFEGSRRQLRG